jgi:hypothetical protein
MEKTAIYTVTKKYKPKQARAITYYKEWADMLYAIVTQNKDLYDNTIFVLIDTDSEGFETVLKRQTVKQFLNNF